MRVIETLILCILRSMRVIETLILCILRSMRVIETLILCILRSMHRITPVTAASMLLAALDPAEPGVVHFE